MNLSDLSRNAYLLCGSLSRKGYMRWFHSFSAVSAKTGEHRVFFIEYLIMNPSLGCSKPILGQLPFHRRKGLRPSYLMIKAGAFSGDNNSSALQLHHFYPMTDLKIAFHPFVMKFGENFYSEQLLRGSVSVSPQDARRKSHMCNAGFMKWDVKLHKEIACHTGTLADPLHCAMNALDSFWHGEGIKALYSGTVILNGEEFEVTPGESYGYADKHWGHRFQAPWLQLGTCRLISERTGKELKHSALAADGCCPRFLWKTLKQKLLLQLTYEGQDFEFNFSPFQQCCKWRIHYTDKRLIWQIAARSKDAEIKITMTGHLRDSLCLTYEDPMANLPGRLHAGGKGTGKILLYRKTSGQKELIDTLTAKNILWICEEDAQE